MIDMQLDIARHFFVHLLFPSFQREPSFYLLCAIVELRCGNEELAHEILPKFCFTPARYLDARKVAIHLALCFTLINVFKLKYMEAVQYLQLKVFAIPVWINCQVILS